jgi:uncharacterized membrane protein (DUF485 family)
MANDNGLTPDDWARIAYSERMQTLLHRKKRFIVPATIFFIAYYFALPVLVGYFPSFMSRKVAGAVNIAYLFALSQFVMAWIVAALYLRAAGRFDRLSHELLDDELEKLRGRR